MNGSVARDEGDAEVEALRAFLARHPRLFVLSGAGCSTASGIPDYRDEAGGWKRAPPITFAAFTGDDLARRRYWARSMVGWPRMAMAHPNAAHLGLARLERGGRIACLVTQNVDGLHQAAGSRAVIDLHGRIDRVTCLDCMRHSAREDLQSSLRERNPHWTMLDADIAPDGDADLHGRDFAGFVVPHCEACGGMLKPDVVFFGENVPRARVEHAQAALEASDAMFVAGSSLMVYSGYRFVLAAVRLGKPVAAVNLGRTRADELIALKLQRPVSDVFARL